MYQIFLIMCVLLVPATTFAQATVAVTLPVQAYFIKAIAGETITPQILLKKGHDPHTYEPTTKELLNFSNVKYFLTVGLAIEQRWIQRLRHVSPSLQAIDVFDPLTKNKEGISATDSVGSTHHHTHSEDKHLWLSPSHILTMIRNTTAILSKVLPEKGSTYEDNAQKLEQKVWEYIQITEQQLKNKQYRTFVSYHPTWKHFAQDFNLHEIAIEKNLREPSVSDIHKILQQAKDTHVQCIFIQPQHHHAFANIVAKELSIPLILVDPLQCDWFELMLTMRRYLVQYLQ